MSSDQRMDRRAFWRGLKPLAARPAIHSLPTEVPPHASLRQAATAIAPWGPARAEAGPSAPRRAVIQGRHCLAYRALDCTVCVERCAQAQAIVLTAGVPQVDPNRCTGCGDCVQACPAPVPAILLLPALAKRPTTA